MAWPTPDELNGALDRIAADKRSKESLEREYAYFKSRHRGKRDELFADYYVQAMMHGRVFLGLPLEQLARERVEHREHAVEFLKTKKEQES